jgi:hypothetical protein
MLFNVGLVADAGHPRPVKLAAVDLARNSHWFQVGDCWARLGSPRRRRVVWGVRVL